MQPWQLRSMDDYRAAYRRAQEDPEGFWGEIASTFSWHTQWSRVCASDLGTGEISWFSGARLNITENALDRHVRTQPHKTALIWEPADPAQPARRFTYSELLAQVCRTAHMLQRLGVQKGDRVTIYLPMVPELLFCTLACARLGAVHSVVFAGFSSESLATRIADTKSATVVTADGMRRGDRVFSLKPAVDAALRDMPQCPVTKVITLDTKTTELPAPSARDVSWAQAIEGCPAEFAAVSCDSEDPLFILYTSGSTGSPKGIVHTQAGYMVWVAYTFANVFQVDESSIHWCTADLGWITGHSYIAYAPLLLGTTTMMFEGVPTWPNASRLWQAVERHSVTHFYTAPTLIRSLQACDESLVASSNRSSLKVLGTVGEPINASAWQWYFEVVGNSRCPVVDTWWQTETGGIMIAPLAGLSPLRPTYAGLPLPGVLPMLVDDNGREVADTSASGNLCISRPWPGMMRTIFGNFERFLNGYLRPFPGHYFSGDGAMRDVDGLYRVTGRVDDVLNVSGHRLGTAEIENAINKHPALVESAVVGIPDAVTGQSVFAFVVIDNAPGTNEERGRATTPSGNILLAEVQAEVTKHIGALAKPRQVIAVSGLPKTRSGKIMRRILRAIALGESDSLGDTSTLINPEVVTAIVAAVKQAKGAGTV